MKYPLKENKDPSKLEDQQETKIINGVKMNSIPRDSEGNTIKRNNETEIRVEQNPI